VECDIIMMGWELAERQVCDSDGGVKIDNKKCHNF